MNPSPRVDRAIRLVFATTLAAAVLASAAPIGCGPPDAGTIKGPSKDELTKNVLPESRTRSGKTIDGGTQTAPVPARR